MQKALCSACPTRFGDYGPHGWGDWKSNGRGTHTRVCKHNDSHTETKDCTFSVAPCAEPAACTECGAVYSLDHDWGRWTSNGNKTHTRTCKRDSGHVETKSCDIREATCADPAWCRECYGEYGSADPNKHEWSPNSDGTHSADCRRVGCNHTGKTECEKLEYCLRFADAEDYAFELCPVCGEVSNGARLTLIEEARATAQRLPRGKLTLRIGDLQNGERMLSVGFEYGGRLTLPTGQVEIMLPAAMLDGYALMLLDADGVETALPHTLNGDEATFTLDFTTNGGPALALRLISVS